jgi:hypothetical protein
LRQAEETLGREVNVIIYPAAEFRSKLKEGHHFVSSILKGKKIYVIGGKDDLAGLAEKSIPD